ncbi:hypothetical protein BGZ98_005906, partial [Dissophora globulifera]
PTIDESVLDLDLIAISTNPTPSALESSCFQLGAQLSTNDHRSPRTLLDFIKLKNLLGSISPLTATTVSL